jgi:glycosyltransferase involved in cell wall biosynthesis
VTIAAAPGVGSAIYAKRDARVDVAMADQTGTASRELSVIAESAYPEIAAGSRVRVVEMGTHLRPLGVRVHFRPSLTSAEYRLVASPGITSRKAIALVRSAARSARRPRSASDTLIFVHRLRSLMWQPDDDAPLDVYDLDDAIYLGATSSHHSRFRLLKREASRCRRYMRSARLVLAGNEVLASAAREHSRRVELIPSCVDASLQTIRRHQEVEQLTLAWIGSRTTTGYLDPVLEVVAQLNARKFPVRLVAMGATPLPIAPWLEQREWSLEAERDLLTKVDVGVMPLPDDPWARGKCGYKLLRYFSAGLPTIASPVGINTRLLARGEGIAATTSLEWSRAIECLGRDAQMRAQIGAAARALVERDYSYHLWAPRVAALLRELA